MSILKETVKFCIMLRHMTHPEIWSLDVAIHYFQPNGERLSLESFLKEGLLAEFKDTLKKAPADKNYGYHHPLPYRINSAYYKQG